MTAKEIYCQDTVQITPKTEQASLESVDIKVEQEFKTELMNASVGFEEDDVSCKDGILEGENSRKRRKRNGKSGIKKTNDKKKTRAPKQNSKRSESKKICEDCGKEFKSSYILRKHMEAVHKTKSYSCDKCDYTCYGKPNLFHHDLKFHKAPKRFLCDQCDYVTCTSTQLKDHISIKHLGITFPCTMCDHVAYYSHRLRHHIRKVHENLRHPCDACDKVYNNADSLRNHKDSVHLNVRLPCPECGHISTNKGYLQKHMRLHHKATVQDSPN